MTDAVRIVARAVIRSTVLVLVAVTFAFILERFLPRIADDPRPWVEQYLGWFTALRDPVASPPIFRALPWTIAIVGTGTAIAIAVGTLLGAWQGRRDRGLGSMAAWLPVLLAACTPAWFIGLILVWLFGVTLRWMPTGNAIGPLQRWVDPVEVLLDLGGHALLPIASIAIAGVGMFAVAMRALVTSDRGADHAIYGESLGIGDRRRFLGWEVRPALAPQLTGAALALGTIVTGAFFVEAVFSYPGLGWLFVHAIERYDFPTVRGVMLLLVISVALLTMAIDLAVPLLDPRVRRG